MIKKRWSKSLSLFVPSQKLKLELEEEDFEKLWVAKYLFLILTLYHSYKREKMQNSPRWLTNNFWECNLFVIWEAFV